MVQYTKDPLKTPDNPKEDEAAVALLHRVDGLRTELRIAEQELGTAVSAYGRRRGYVTYREFYLRNALNTQNYKEQHNNVR